MKRIVNYIFLIVICLLPVMVDAKVKVEYEWDVLDYAFLYKEKDNNYFLGYNDYYFNIDYFELYDEDGNYISSKEFEDANLFETEEEFFASKRFEEFEDKIYIVNKEVFDRDTKRFMYVQYYDECFQYYDDVNSKSIYIPFEDDINYTKKLLGKKYDLFMELVDQGYEVEHIIESNGYFGVMHFVDYYENMYFSVFDNQYKEIFKFKVGEYYNNLFYVHDGLIYIDSEYNKIDIYKLDGTKYDSFTMTYEHFRKNDYDYCGSYVPRYMYIENNEMFITFSRYVCLERIDMRDANSDISTGRDLRSFTLKYDIDYGVNKISSSNGDFTYEKKVDDDGNSYVELKVVPKDGYSVEEIIVTDVNGDRIEVTDNKFYRPLNDVTIEVKYVKGEYLPIPDTFLGKSVSLIIIGLILVSLGFYTINYVGQE
ncbi:MAG: hypothetical protein IJ463_02440 [Bacilli bacterium]|nr:hypothetical protein [Bacilli bacterium]